MDFLVLFLLYLALVLTAAVLTCICLRTQHLKGLVGRGSQISSWIVPACLQRAGRRLVHFLFHTRYLCLMVAQWVSMGLPAERNYFFIVLHLTLQGLVYAEYTWEILGYCRELGFSLHCLLLPYLLLLVNLVFFTLSCVTDPGTITKANEAALLDVYAFDDVMFPKNVRCSTCDLRKPARSKHCRVCNRCVHRFDHHCVWVNNCIGAWNTGYFLVYLSTLTAAAVAVASVSTALLFQVAFVSDFYQETYLDEQGHSQVVGTIFIVQFLFLLFPRIVFLLGFVIVLSCLLGGYLCFALYLAATNQTTNEWYRAGRVSAGTAASMLSSPRSSPESSRIFSAGKSGATLERPPSVPHMRKRRPRVKGVTAS